MLQRCAHSAPLQRNAFMDKKKCDVGVEVSRYLLKVKRTSALHCATWQQHPPFIPIQFFMYSSSGCFACKDNT